MERKSDRSTLTIVEQNHSTANMVALLDQATDDRSHLRNNYSNIGMRDDNSWFGDETIRENNKQILEIESKRADIDQQETLQVLSNNHDIRQQYLKCMNEEQKRHKKLTEKRLKKEMKEIKLEHKQKKGELENEHQEKLMRLELEHRENMARVVLENAPSVEKLEKNGGLLSSFLGRFFESTSGRVNHNADNNVTSKTNKP